ncbi:MAG TPA: hypothetical protein VNN77_12340 [candidate division Zixibacteria bacterium]|nr:hypothetical protein [candidate division Zixibacteria bacterium]
MFVENYHLEKNESMMVAGGKTHPIPYPKISPEDWRVWRTFLPVRSQNIDQVAARNLSPYALNLAEGIPYSVTGEMQKASKYFERIEVWRQRHVDKDPIAVGLLGGERYLIARWGMEQLLPFEAIKKSMPLILAWKYATSPLGVTGAAAAVCALVWAILG